MLNATLEQQIKRAQAAGREKLHRGPLALDVRFFDETHELLLTLTSGEELRLPIDQLQGLSGASGEALRNVEIVSHGLGLHWEELDADLLVPELVKGVYGTQSWMRAIGARGGRASTEAKRQAAQENGARGGRPRVSKGRREGKGCYLLIEYKAVPSHPQYVGVLMANNGRSLLWTRPFPRKEEVLGCWNTIQQLAVDQDLCFERQRVNEGWQFEVRTCDGTPLGRSAPYASKSTASRALGTLGAAISGAHVSETH